MSGSFEELDVPPTLVSFAVTAGSTGSVISPEFKRAGDRIAYMGADPFDAAATMALWEEIESLMRAGKVRAGLVRRYRRHSGGPLQDELRQPAGRRAGRRV